MPRAAGCAIAVTLVVGVRAGGPRPPPFRAPDSALARAPFRRPDGRGQALRSPPARRWRGVGDRALSVRFRLRRARPPSRRWRSVCDPGAARHRDRGPGAEAMPTQGTRSRPLSRPRLEARSGARADSSRAGSGGLGDRVEEQAQRLPRCGCSFGVEHRVASGPPSLPRADFQSWACPGGPETWSARAENGGKAEEASPRTAWARRPRPARGPVLGGPTRRATNRAITSIMLAWRLFARPDVDHRDQGHARSAERSGALRRRAGRWRGRSAAPRRSNRPVRSWPPECAHATPSRYEHRKPTGPSARARLG
jgi:hypothetical protein